MPPVKLNFCFIRRGYSATGGAEAYLKRLAEGLVEAGHEASLLTTDDWPAKEWTFGQVSRIGTKSPIGFANEIERIRVDLTCDLVVSLERICRCDIYRAGDGVHQAWLSRRQHFEAPWRPFLRKLQRKHRDLLRLEQALLDERGANRVIANSRMVKREIVDLYNYRRDRIEIVYNGIPFQDFEYDPARRDQARAGIGAGAEDTVVLFVGTGWERKGLRYAIAAVEAYERPGIRLLVAGRGSSAQYSSARAQFVGEVADLRPIYAASDVFILPTIYDPFSNACLEALASGLPVITTRANGFSEIMEDRIHGSIVDAADNVADLTTAIEDWADPTRRVAARPNILQRASQFDISRNVKETLRILVQAAGRRGDVA
jgi:UDP-glucose:(heptosyl)LPS alpha-1,3-glucosyltransferase